MRLSNPRAVALILAASLLGLVEVACSSIGPGATPPASPANEDVVIEAALEAGASDVVNFGSTFSVTTAPNELDTVKGALEGKKIPVANAEVAMVPQTMIKLEDRSAEQMLKLMEALEEHDDVQKVYANFDIDDSILERLSSE